MARSTGSETGKKTEPAASDPSGEARAATLDRIAAKIERLSPQRRALRKAYSSPDVEPDELHRQVRLPLRHLPRLMRRYVGWLQRYGVEL